MTSFKSSLLVGELAAGGRARSGETSQQALAVIPGGHGAWSRVVAAEVARSGGIL